MQGEKAGGSATVRIMHTSSKPHSTKGAVYACDRAGLAFGASHDGLLASPLLLPLPMGF